jgi:hypothetical protein
VYDLEEKAWILCDQRLRLRERSSALSSAFLLPQPKLPTLPLCLYLYLYLVLLRLRKDFCIGYGGAVNLYELRLWTGWLLPRIATVSSSL